MGRGAAAEPAIEAIFRREYAGLVRALTVAVADRHAAEELAQEVFVQLVRHWDRVQGYEAPEAWLRRVAAGRAANHRRDRARRADVVTRLWRADRPPVDGTPPDPEDDLLAALLALPDGQRRAVALHYLLDQPSSVVAEQLGVADGTVRSQLHAARQRLGRTLSPEGGTDR